MRLRMGYAEDSRVSRFEGLAAAGFGKLRACRSAKIAQRFSMLNDVSW
jgi:hypothetical protein